MAAQFYPQQVQYAQAMSQIDPQNGPMLLASTLQAAFQGNNELMKRILETFDTQNPDVFIPSPQAPGQGHTAQAPAPGAGVSTQALGGAFGPSPLAQGIDPLSAMLGIA